MGAENSTFCSMNAANGYLAHDVKVTASCAPCPSKYESQQMEFGSSTAPVSDRVDPWTRDLISTAGCGTCDSATTAPKGYLADSQGDAAIVQDSREGPMWVDDDRDSRPVHLDPDESGDRETQLLLPLTPTQPGTTQAL
mmetsp:Transcript_69024/g.133202  ORF Transcript_69024/g.133202 Transcript_69024/m.133202 type:complete len:139 (+) Transcript_69024:57-473(+)|eukprot:CAMPEP_0172716438 /NCGR_PEP_ID=MMETSP1074-20121228/68383_1 /TAXON_ID=2916 /ORGANISM="Ceratium fusus, Strain PA161109" /LENGTH=138 /DNA_ID=CAMNT_0013541131 /DNA_START=54 /DNA_END=470 /DNA_ORIENTATION=+